MFLLWLLVLIGIPIVLRLRTRVTTLESEVARQQQLLQTLSEQLRRARPKADAEVADAGGARSVVKPEAAKPTPAEPVLTKPSAPPPASAPPPPMAPPRPAVPPRPPVVTPPPVATQPPPVPAPVPALQSKTETASSASPPAAVPPPPPRREPPPLPPEPPSPRFAIDWEAFV